MDEETTKANETNDTPVYSPDQSTSLTYDEE